ncbi:M35 family metallo-endopeptidase [Streptomyces sp. NPDC057695]|uniref:M35 family metallo-endopeptidase n=1 Tax=Streptomyces sp. NPDC057695 TaxID=3346217 RepID=UPI0036A359FE
MDVSVDGHARFRQGRALGSRTVWLCGSFWSAPMTGTDSKFGTLVHEWSHAKCSTEDFAYGEAACLNLAVTDPRKAIYNADNVEYFAEHL